MTRLALPVTAESSRSARRCSDLKNGRACEALVARAAIEEEHLAQSPGMPPQVQHVCGALQGGGVHAAGHRAHPVRGRRRHRLCRVRCHARIRLLVLNIARSTFGRSSWMMDLWVPCFAEHACQFMSRAVPVGRHVHAYERCNRVYNYSVDPCGPIHITIGDGGVCLLAFYHYCCMHGNVLHNSVQVVPHILACFIAQAILSSYTQNGWTGRRGAARAPTQRCAHPSRTATSAPRPSRPGQLSGGLMS